MDEYTDRINNVLAVSFTKWEITARISQSLIDFLGAFVENYPFRKLLLQFAFDVPNFGLNECAFLIFHVQLHADSKLSNNFMDLISVFYFLWEVIGVQFQNVILNFLYY